MVLRPGFLSRYALVYQIYIYIVIMYEVGGKEGIRFGWHIEGVTPVATPVKLNSYQ